MSSVLLKDNIYIGDLAAALAENLAPVVYPPGAVIFHQGEAAGYAYLIERGQVRITQTLGADQQLLAVLGPGELLGEMAPIDHQDRSATAAALTETEVIPISRDRFDKSIEGADPLLQMLLRVLIERLRSTKSSDDRQGGTLELLEQVSNSSFETIRGRAIDKLKLEKALRDGLKNREFQLYFQPIIRLTDSRIAGFEALIRWMSPDEGLVPPSKFIAIAEESGLIVPLGHWVLEHSCHMLSRFQARFNQIHPEDGEPLFVSCNVSARQLRRDANVDDLVATIKSADIDPSCLKLEITEGLLLENPELAIAAFKKFKSLGVTLAFDDFGTGYSSLSYLHRFPLDTLKIDQSFISSMLDNKESLAIVRTITTLSRELGMDSVAEGIEHAEAIGPLLKLGCDYGQGYYFARPMPASEALELLDQVTLPLD